MTYTFPNNISNNNGKDSAEAKRLAASVADKLPAFLQFWKFVADSMSGLRPQIKEDVIDDAFDCMIDRTKLSIECSSMTKEEKEYRKQQEEAAMKTIKEGLKSSLQQI